MLRRLTSPERVVFRLWAGMGRLRSIRRRGAPARGEAGTAGGRAYRGPSGRVPSGPGPLACSGGGAAGGVTPAEDPRPGQVVPPALGADLDHVAGEGPGPTGQRL